MGTYLTQNSGAMNKKNLIYGLHAVKAALQRKPETIREVWLDKDRRDTRINEILLDAQGAGISVQRVKRRLLDDMTDHARHQGVVARCTVAPALDETTLPTLLAGLQEAPLLLVLDSVQDPHNLGACLRTADAAGVHAVIAPRDRSCGLTAAVRKVASGAVGNVPFVQVTNLARSLRQLKQAGVWVMGTDAGASLSAYEADLACPLALVVGAEDRGIRRLIREQCDGLIKLPMHGHVASLNVSVATGICLYEALRQRTQ